MSADDASQPTEPTARSDTGTAVGIGCLGAFGMFVLLLLALNHPPYGLPLLVLAATLAAITAVRGKPSTRYIAARALIGAGIVLVALGLCWVAVWSSM